ncbi:MAG: apolipoprotein N-acyltransferase [Acidimicrobiia bacterium]
MTRTARRWPALAAARGAGDARARALPPWGVWPLAFAAWAVLHAICRGVGAGAQAALAATFAAAWLAIGAGWMWHLTAPGYVVAVAAFAALHALAAALAATLSRRRPGASAWARPAAHALAEAVRWSAPFGGVPIATVPIALATTPYASLASLGGPVLVGWAAMQAGTLLAEVVHAARRRDPLGPLALGAAGLAALGALGGPLARLGVHDAGGEVRLALVQGGGPQGVLAIRTDPRRVVERHLDATRAIGAGDGLDAVVWPENVVDVADFAASGARVEVAAEAARLGAPLLIGVTEDAGPGRFVNAHVVVLPDGAIAGRYDKVRRVPFGEYVPAGLRGALASIGAPVDRVPTDAVAGDGPASLRITAGDREPATLGVSISWEAFFAGRANAGVEAGGGALVNPTNGSSYTGTILQRQQVATNALRAIEQSRWLAQVATTGYTTVLAPDGAQVGGRRGTPDGPAARELDIGEAGVLVAALPLREGRTIYSRLGDGPWIAALAAPLGFAALRRPRRVRLAVGDAARGVACTVSARDGARLASLVVDGRERLLTAAPDGRAMGWGAYPMVPWAGRVRRGAFTHAGVTHRLAINHGDHAIHGTVFDVAWRVVHADARGVRMTADLGPRWPLGGSVSHEVRLVDDSDGTSVECTLEVTAADASMPVQVGWHPWFVRPCTLDASFREMYVRDADGIPTGARVAPTPGPHDDCFTGALAAPVVRWDDLALRVESDCSHWVVYDQPSHALCVEPQSGPPDGFTIEPLVLAPRATMRRTMRIVVVREPRAAGHDAGSRQ